MTEEQYLDSEELIEKLATCHTDKAQDILQMIRDRQNGIDSTLPEPTAADSWLGFAIFIVIIGSIYYGLFASDSNAIPYDDFGSNAPAKSWEVSEKERKGFHCLSAWDGSIRSVVRNVKYRMKDPKSFEHIETRITPVSNGQHTAVMTYRGRNGFGGMVVETEYTTVSNSSCS